MNTRFLKAVFVGSIFQFAAVTTIGAETSWNRVVPDGAGFSIEAPGAPQPTAGPGQYVYTSGLWHLSVTIQAIDAPIPQFFERRERKALVQCLELVGDSMAGAVGATRNGSSSGDIDGYPSLRFTLESNELEGINLLVLTRQHLYLVMTIGPKGTRNEDAKRFLGSFHLVTTNGPASADTNAIGTPTVAETLAGPMLAVARLVLREKMDPLIDEVVQNAPPAARLGNRWTPSHAAFQEARTSISSRIERIADAYEKSGDVRRALESEFAQLSPESQAALTAQLTGPAGPAIVRQLARTQFVSMLMAGTPNGPEPGQPAWRDKLRTLQTLFDQRIGTTIPPDDGSHKAAVETFFSTPANDGSRICFAAVARATGDLEGAINLMMFDDSQAIGREVETVIARVK
jgi:hypothetical protein